MENIYELINTLSSNEIHIIARQISRIKEIWSKVLIESKEYFCPCDNRCIHLKILIDGEDVEYHRTYSSTICTQYHPYNIYLDIFNNYTKYRLFSLPDAKDVDKIIPQDNGVFLILRKSDTKKTISSKDSIVKAKFPIITLCGSTKFKEEFIQAQKELTLSGNIVISVGLFGHSGDKEAWVNKEMLDMMHLEKIRMADKIYVINKDNYIGESTRKEIEFAKSIGKEVLYMY